MCVCVCVCVCILQYYESVYCQARIAYCLFLLFSLFSFEKPTLSLPIPGYLRHSADTFGYSFNVGILALFLFLHFCESVCCLDQITY